MAQPAVGEIVDGYRFNGGDPNTESSWSKGPKAGDVVDGYMFRGGDPNDKNSWGKPSDTQVTDLSANPAFVNPETDSGQTALPEVDAGQISSLDLGGKRNDDWRDGSAPGASMTALPDNVQLRKSPAYQPRLGPAGSIASEIGDVALTGGEAIKGTFNKAADFLSSAGAVAGHKMGMLSDEDYMLAVQTLGDRRKEHAEHEAALRQPETIPGKAAAGILKMAPLFIPGVGEVYLPMMGMEGGADKLADSADRNYGDGTTLARAGLGIAGNVLVGSIPGTNWATPFASSVPRAAASLGIKGAEMTTAMAGLEAGDIGIRQAGGDQKANFGEMLQPGHSLDPETAAVSFITGAGARAIHTGREYAGRNTLNTNAQSDLGLQLRADGKPFDSEQAAQNFIAANGLDKNVPIPMFSKEGSVVGYGVKFDPYTNAKIDWSKGTLVPKPAEPADILKTNSIDEAVAKAQEAISKPIDTTPQVIAANAAKATAEANAANADVVSQMLATRPLKPVEKPAEVVPEVKAEEVKADIVPEAAVMPEQKAETPSGKEIAFPYRDTAIGPVQKHVTNEVTREQLPMAGPGRTNGVTREMFDLMQRVDAQSGTRHVIVDSLPHNSGGATFGKDGTIYVAKNAKINPASISGHEVWHVIESVLGANHPAVEAVKETINRNLTPTAKARFVHDFLNTDTATLKNLGVSLSPERGRAADFNVLSKQEKAALANYYDANPKLHSESAADMHGEAAKTTEFWTNVFTELKNHYSAAEAQTKIGKMIEAMKQTMAGFVAATQGRMNFAIRQHIKNMEEVNQALAKAHAEWRKSTGDFEPVKEMGRKYQSNTKIDSSKDSLFAAIAKSGGMDTNELLSNGFDLSDISRQHSRVNKKTGMLTKPVWKALNVGFNQPLHKNGGMSFDGMRETLVQHGYLPEGASKNDMIDLFRQELHGDKVYTPHAADRIAEESRINADKMAEKKAAAEANRKNPIEPGEEKAWDHFADEVYNADDPIEAFRRGMRLDGATEAEINDTIKATFGSRESTVDHTATPEKRSETERIAERLAHDEDDAGLGGKSGAEPDWLTGQTTEEVKAQNVKRNENAITKEQADRERDAVPFSPEQESQPKPQGRQDALFSPERAEPKGKEYPQEAWDALRDFWVNMSGHKDLYSFPTTKSDNLVHAFNHVIRVKDPSMTIHELDPFVKGKDNENELNMTKAIPGGRSWSIFNAKSANKDVAIGQIHEKNGNVWISVPGMKSGSGMGAGVYSAVGQYARNAGKKFIGDPAGFTGNEGARLGEIRRVEHLISQALRYGSTDHVTLGDRHPLNSQWKTGDFHHNVDLMLKTAYDNYKWIFDAQPELGEVHFDVKSEQFFDPFGERVTDAAFEKLLAVKGGGIRSASGLRGSTIGEKIGVATAKRAIIARSILQGIRSGSDGRLLDNIDAKLDSVGLGRESSVRGIQYSPERAESSINEPAKAPVFYSQLSRSVEQMPDKVSGTSAQNVKMWLLSNKAKLGIKQDEIQWTGITDWLDLQGKNKVTKEQVAEYLKDGGVKVQEVMKGDQAQKMADIQSRIDAINEEFNSIIDEHGKPVHELPDGAKRRIDKLTEQHDALADQLANMHPSDDGVKFGQYVVPGGENYRELLLTLPPKSVVEPVLAEGRWRLRDKSSGSFLRDPQNKVFGFANEAEAKAAIAQMSDKGMNGFVPGFHSSHWDEANVLAHIRFDERTDADGKRVLFVQELQSDWGQKGKKEGFSTSDYEVRGRDGVIGKFATREEADAFAKKYHKETGKNISMGKSQGLPTAPFVTDTKAWLSLGLKRVISYAAEHGFDKIAWANGDQNAGHYDLSKQISRVKYEDNSTGGIGMAKMSGEPTSGMLYAYDLNNKEVIAKHVEPSEVADHIGKDAAERLFAETPESGNAAGLGIRRRQIRGLDLKVGGEGMKTFYDQIVPQVANDVLKKVGGGRVENVEVAKNGREGRSVRAEDRARMKLEGSLLEQQGFTITPAMRDKVATEGLPLFSRKRSIEVDGTERPTLNSNGKPIHPTEEGVRNFWKWFGDSKVVDAEGRPLVVYHGTQDDITAFDENKGYKTDPGWLGRGFYFTTNTDTARFYSTNAKTGKADPNILPVYLSIQNPKEATTRDKEEGALKSFGNKPDFAIAKRNELRAAGYDGVILDFKKGGFANELEVVVFDANQIKSATGNTGDFNPANADIRYSRKREETPLPADQANEHSNKALREIGLFANPMSVGNNLKAQAEAFRFANSMRRAQWEWITLQDTLTKNFKQEQLTRMWDAADEENEIRSGRMKASPDKGIDSLPKTEREALDTLHAYANELLQRAKDVGMFQGEGVPYWAPRMAVMIGEDGQFAPFEFNKDGGGDVRNLRTNSQNLKQRKYATAEEYHAAVSRAAEAVGKKGAEVVRDIRTMPLALARLERAIAGRELVEQVRREGQLIGKDLVVDNATGDRNYFTLDHPAFTRFIKNEDGTVERRAMYIDKSWEGPLKAVLEQSIPAEELYKKYMQVKAESMNYIMASPLTHNMVIFGRAMAHGVPVVSALQAYFIGNKAKDNRGLMREMIDHGLVPIGHKGFLQDATGLMEADSLKPGNSLTSQGIGYVAKKLGGEKFSESVKEGIDKAGDFWHNTLLWNRIGDLQRGIYIQAKEAMIKDGMIADVAAYEAAHLANRFAGSIPNEAVSKGARALMNMTFFSRTFQQANLGIIKDAIVGLPAGPRAVITELYGAETAKKASNSVKWEERRAIAKDFVLAFALNNVLQATFANMMKDDEDGSKWDKLSKAYAQRYEEMIAKGKEHWMNWLNPYFVPNSLSLMSANEEGKEQRIRVGEDKNNTATYMRNPIGKIPEELEAWILHPGKTMGNKLSPIVKGVAESVMNDKGYGKHVYKDNDEWLIRAAKSLVHVAELQIPVDVIKAHKDYFLGDEAISDPNLPKSINTGERQKIVGFWTGLSVSNGSPGGPENAEKYSVDKRFKQDVEEVMPKVKDLVKHGKIDEAWDILDKVGMLPKEINTKIRQIENPQLNQKGINKVMKHATEAERMKLDSVYQNEDNRRKWATVEEE